MQPMSAARRRALRAVLSALAGGGMTAASLLGPAPGAASGAGTATTPSSAEATTTSPAPTETAVTQPTAPPATSTTTTPASPPAAESTTTTPPAPAPKPKPAEVPTVILQRRQSVTPGAKPSPSTTSTAPGSAKAAKEAAGANNVALSPQLIAAQANLLASSAASIQALGFYRIPLFLLPIYKAAAVQYGVPWQILAAVNEIETNYGIDLAVSSAGAVGWMQFMPATWLQYGVDALNAGYADPYNPVDAIFAAARYLRAAGAASDLHAAILAYNHSEEYVSSVLLRAKLISTYPRSVIATLTGLIDGRLPVSGGKVAWSALPSQTVASASATANATQLAGGSQGATAASAASGSHAATPGSSAAPSPSAAALGARSAQPQLMDELTSAPGAQVVAVQNGRVVELGSSRALGRYVILRDVYGDLFTYAGLGTITPTYVLPKPAAVQSRSPVVEVASKSDPAPAQAASEGVQSPLTLQVKAPKQAGGAFSLASGQAQEPAEAMPTGASKVRLFAHPGNPDARSAAAARSATRARAERVAKRQPLRSGAVVASGTVLGTVSSTPGASAGHLRFAIRPAGDAGTIDPGPVLANWAQLQAALHPQGAKAQDALLGATASDVFLLSKAELQRTVLADPGITIYACGRHDVATGAIDRRVLAVLAFLSRSGLKPTVTGLHCGQSPVTSSGAVSAAYQGDAAEISAINGTALAGHQGAGTITDHTIRTLLTLPAEFLPGTILSLMRYPGAPSTHADSSYWNRIRLEFRPAAASVALAPAAAGAGAHARASRLAAVPLFNTSSLTAAQWNQLVSRIGSLPVPTVAPKPTSAAIPDPKAR
jgi:soluble lytic murein transglycosylase-like protein